MAQLWRYLGRVLLGLGFLLAVLVYGLVPTLLGLALVALLVLVLL